MRIRFLPVVLLLTLQPAHSQFTPGGAVKAIVDPDFDAVFPQIAAGESWSTRITLFNMDTAPARGAIIFADANGDDLALTFTGLPNPTPVLMFEIPANGSITTETTNTGALRQGYGLMVTVPPFGNERKVGGIAVFRQRVEERPEFEAAVPLSPITERRFRVPFDNTAGFETGVAFTSFGIGPDGEISQNPINVQAEYWDEKGVRIGSGIVTIPAMGHTAFALSQKFPELRDRAGVIEFRSPMDFMTGLGLRFNPGGAFTSLPAASLLEWHDPPSGEVMSRP
jgi:hypothetical protein